MRRDSLAGIYGSQRLREAARVALTTVDEEPIEVTKISRGNRKQTAIATFPTRGPVVVQLCAERTWLRTEATLLREIRRRTFVPVPPVLAAGTHNGIAYMLTAYVAGDDLHQRFTAVSEETRRDLARWFGKALARLHEVFTFNSYGRLNPSDRGLTGGGRTWPNWVTEYGRQAIDRLPDPFDPIRDELHELLGHIPATEPPARLFPWDFRPGNALVVDGSITAVLDWEAPLAAPPALSVAKCEYLVADWYVSDPDPLRRAFESGYTAVRQYPSIHPSHRAVAIADSAVDSNGVVTNPGYPPVGREEAIQFHRVGLTELVGDS